VEVLSSPVNNPTPKDRPTRAVIHVDGLRVRYGETDVVDGVSFDVHAGEVVALLGPNGAGKTTTVEVLEGHRRRSAGSVDVLGFDPQRGRRAFRERIGIVLQEAGLDGDLTVHEALTVFAGLYPHPRDIDEIMAIVELEPKRRARVRTLSGGQRRRLDLALALVGKPDLLFLDEPTTGFDPQARQRAWSLLETVRGGGATILLTSHYMEEVERLADRVVVLLRGHVVATGPPSSLGDAKRSEAVMRFQLPHRLAALELPPDVAAIADIDGLDVVIRSGQPTSVLASLTQWALGRGEELRELTVSRPTLEEVLIDLTSNSKGQSEAP
jgi:ABC-2 type transport system ATP-binding protein